MSLIAIVEDDLNQRLLLEKLLSGQSHEINSFAKASEFLTQFSQYNFDLIVLDWFLPDGTAEIIVKMLREGINSQTPIIVLSSNDSNDCISQILLNGADDYVIKPLDPKVFLARVDVQLRRQKTVELPPVETEVTELNFGPYRVDLGAEIIEIEGKRADLSSSEARLAVFLFRHFGELVERDIIMREVWGEYSVTLNTRTLDSTAYKLRKKLQLLPEHGFQLVSVRSHGYRLEAVKS